MIAVIGDYIEDIYIYGTVDRISPESPIPVFKSKTTEFRSGGAGNVYENLQALGSDTEIFASFNSKKTRFVCDNHIMFRSDEEEYIPNQDIDFPVNPDYVILSDYNKGFLHHSQLIVDNFIKKGSKVIVDPKKPIDNYKNSSIIKLNQKELEEYGFGNTPFQLRKLFNIGSIVVTKGENGVYISSDDFEGEISTDKHPVSDVTGAGDVFIAAMTHYLSIGNNLYDACSKAVRLASISVTKFGTYVLSKENIAKNSVVFTNGCFDILHRGHIEYLKESRKLGYKLIVGLNSDESIKRLKGEQRPINNQKDRKAVLEALDCVDEVIIFNEDTPYELIKKLKPDIITKGGDYKPEEVVGNDLTKVVIIPFVKGYSTTKTLEHLNADCQ
jgi:D-beta-D-heptose 7-phosphate kinase/D-beta-D-heptose 1-phosphate adenosyltransferase